VFSWYGNELREHVRAHYLSRVYQAAEAVRQQVQRNISVSSRGGPSQPGEYPHADTGALRNSIFAEVDARRLNFRVGTPLKYGLWLEYGTAGGRVIRPTHGTTLSWRDPRSGRIVYAKWVRQGAIRQRSFLRRTLVEMRPWLAAFFTREIPDMGARFRIG
jgi:hypothetical protein